MTTPASCPGVVERRLGCHGYPVLFFGLKCEKEKQSDAAPDPLPVKPHRVPYSPTGAVNITFTCSETGAKKGEFSERDFVAGIASQRPLQCVKRTRIGRKCTYVILGPEML